MKRSHLIALAATWQFIFMVDFMLPLPLGPSLSTSLGFAADQMGWLAFAYTVASLLAGLAGALYVPRWGQQRVIVWGLAVFALAQLLTATASQLAGLLACRALSGLAGAPVSAVLMAMVVDAAPPEQRGRTIARVMTGSSLAAIVGVPLALVLAQGLDWRGVFVLMAVSASTLLAVAMFVLPSLFDVEPRSASAQTLKGVKGLKGGKGSKGVQHLRELMSHPDVRWACALQVLSPFSTFLIIPTLAAYLVLNLGVAQDHLPYLYGVGGLVALLCMRTSAWAMDRWPWAPPLWLGCVGVAVALVLLTGPASASAGWRVLVGFVLFMGANAAKNVSMATATAAWAPPAQRASFMNLVSAVQDLSILLASALGTVVLSQAGPHTALTGMSSLMQIATVLVLLLPLLYGWRMRAVAVVSGGPVTDEVAG